MGGWGRGGGGCRGFKVCERKIPRTDARNRPAPGRKRLLIVFRTHNRELIDARWRPLQSGDPSTAPQSQSPVLTNAAWSTAMNLRPIGPGVAPG